MVTEKQKKILQHMLGADERYLKKEWGFRNHYTLEYGSDGFDDLTEMENLGLVKRGNRLDSVVFWATKQGALEIGFKPAQLRRTSLAA